MRRALLLALALALAGPVTARAAEVVRLVPETVVQGDDILLAELGSVEADAALAARLGALKIAPAPVPGITVAIAAESIRARLRSISPEAGRVQVAGAPRVLVTRAFHTVRGVDLVEAVRERARARLDAAAARGEPVALTPITTPEDLKVPTGDLALDVRLHEMAPGAPTLAATVTVRVSGREHRHVPLTFQLRRLVRVAVVARPLEPRRGLHADDVRLEQRPATEVPADALADLGEVADLEVLRPVQPGEVLTPRVVRPRLAVKRGELVTLVLEGTGFRITTQAQASEDGRRGDSVRVVNLSSKREVMGTVEGGGLVRVPYRSLGAR
jgi:flagella basal body P-ring formation protein FlgA